MWCVSLPSCFSPLICMQMWDHTIPQPQPCCVSCPPHLPVSASPTSLNVCSFFNLWLSYFRIVQFSGSSGYFLFLNLLSFFWLCKEAKCRYVVVLICISLMTYDVEPLFMCLLAICISPLVKCLFWSFDNCKIELFSYCWVLVYFGYKFYFANVFLACLFILLTVSFTEQNFSF